MNIENIKFDTITLLSFGLAFFSIAISIAFYFKADKSSADFFHQLIELISTQSNSISAIKAQVETFSSSVKSNIQHRTDELNSATLILDENDASLQATMKKATEESKVNPDVSKEIDRILGEKRRATTKIREASTYLRQAPDEFDKFTSSIFAPKTINSKQMWRIKGQDFNTINNYATQLPKGSIIWDEERIDLKRLSNRRAAEGMRKGVFDSHGNLTEIASIIIKSLRK